MDLDATGLASCPMMGFFDITSVLKFLVLVSVGPLS